MRELKWKKPQINVKVWQMNEIELLIVFIVTILGAVTTSGLGWADSGTPFNLRKFVPGVIRGIIAAIIVFIPAATGYLGMNLGLVVVLGAFIAGMAVDVTGNRIAGILGIGQGKAAT
jgi:uncharacterized membrane protein